MAISVVQRKSGADNNGVNGAVSAAFTSNNTAGNAIIAIETLALTSLTGSTAISDTQGNTYGTNVYNWTDGSHFVSVAIWIAYNIKAGANTVSISPDGGAVNLHVYEVSGMAASAALDQTHAALQTGTTALNSGTTSTTTLADELLIGIFALDKNDTYTIGSGYSNGLTQSNTAFSSYTEEQVVAATGAYNATATSSSATTSLSVIATFKGVVSSTTAHNLTLLGVGQ